MPRAPSGFKLYARPNSPFWWVRARINSQKWRKSTRVPLAGDRAQAEREAAALYLEALQGAVARAPLPPQLLEHLDLSRLVVDFITEEEATYRGHDEHHVDRYETDLVCYVKTRWKRVEEITTDAWEQAKRDLHRSNGGPLGARSIGHLANTLRHFLRFCAGRGIIATVPEIKSPPTKQQKAEQAHRGAMDEEQRDLFLAALLKLGELRAHRIYSALFWSLLRKGELAALTPRWIDKRAELIRIPSEHAKSGELEEIDLHPRVAAALQAELDERDVVEPDKPVFGTFDFHQEWDDERKGGLFGRALALAGIDRHGLTPHHVARHSAATIAGSKPETSLAEMMALGRWRSADVAGRYLHPTVKHGRRASRRM